MAIRILSCPPVFSLLPDICGLPQQFPTYCDIRTLFQWVNSILLKFNEGNGPDHCIVWCELCSLSSEMHPDPAKGLWGKVQETGTSHPCILKPALPSVCFIPLGSLASFRMILFQKPWSGILSSLILLGLPALLLGSHMFLYFQSPTCGF